MTSPGDRDTLFPSTSLSRTSGGKLLTSLSPNGTSSSSSGSRTHSLSRASSHESLTSFAHPLLSPSASGSSSATGTTSGMPAGSIGRSPSPVPSASATSWDNGFNSGGKGGLGYVPYTPKNRPHAHGHSHTTYGGHVHAPALSHTHSAASTVTASTTPSVLVTHATQEHSSGLDATSKLQLMHLKAAAQALGLDAGTVGWGILEALYSFSSSSAAISIEWEPIWEALGSRRAALLLPREPITGSAHSKKKMEVTPDFVKTHVVFVDYATENQADEVTQVVTLDGLRGYISLPSAQSPSSSSASSASTISITFTSTLHPSTPAFRDIASGNSNHSRGYGALVPCATSNHSAYPTYQLPNHTPSLSLPPRGSLSLPSPTQSTAKGKGKPPLPPRRPPNSSSQSQSQSSSQSQTQSDNPQLRGQSQNQQQNSRFAGFASLFGRRDNTGPSHSRNSSKEMLPPSSTSPTTNADGSSISSRPPSILSVSGASGEEDKDSGSVRSFETQPTSLASGSLNSTSILTANSSILPPASPIPHASSIQILTYTIATSLIHERVLEGIWGGLVDDITTGLESRMDIGVPNASNEKSLTETLDTVPIPPTLSSLILSFLEAERALPVLRTPIPSSSHTHSSSRYTHLQPTGSRSRSTAKTPKAMRLISGSGSLRHTREGREGKEVGREGRESGHGHGHTSDNDDSADEYLYTVNPYDFQDQGEVGLGVGIEARSARWQSVYGEVADLVDVFLDEQFKKISVDAEVEEGIEQRKISEGGDTEEKDAGAESENAGLATDGEGQEMVIDETKRDVLKQQEKERESHRERLTTELLERAEKVLCSVGGIYERLFPSPSPATSQSLSASYDGEDTDDPTQITDTAHDDALASRIAALTMVDFGMGDLDLDVGVDSSVRSASAEEEKSSSKQARERRKALLLERKNLENARRDQVLSIVRSVGGKLARMEAAYTPREKAETLVGAHRGLVDGLTRLPFPIRLKDPEPSPRIQADDDDHSDSDGDADAEGVDKARDGVEEEKDSARAAAEGEDDEEGQRTAVPWKDGFAGRRDEDGDGMKDKGKEVPDMTLKLDSVSTPDPATATSDANLARDSDPSPLLPAQPSSPPPNQPSEPSLPAEPSPSTTTFSLDTLFPLLILAVVFSNPPRLISHLLFTQRFRNRGLGGEQVYCLVNLMAVVEFIGGLEAAGVVAARNGEFHSAGKAKEGAGTPIPIPIPLGELNINRRSAPSSPRTPRTSLTPTSTLPSQSPRLLSTSLQSTSSSDFPAILSSTTTRVLTGVSGVVDSSFGLFRSMNVNIGNVGLGFGTPTTTGPPGSAGAPHTPALGSAQAAAPWNHRTRNSGSTRGDGDNEYFAGGDSEAAMERKDSGTGFSLKGLKLPSMPIIPNIPSIPNMTMPSLSRASTPAPEKAEKEMVSVSRPGSVRSRKSVGSLFGVESSEDDDETGEEEETGEEQSQEGETGEESESQRDDGDELASESEEREDDDDGESDFPDDRSAVSQASSFYRASSDVRSIKSFESMMIDSKKRSKKGFNTKAQSTSTSTARTAKVHDKEKDVGAGKKANAMDIAGVARKSLSDRLARVSSGLGSKINSSTKTISPTASQRSSLLLSTPAHTATAASSTNSRPQSPVGSLNSLNSLQIPLPHNAAPLPPPPPTTLVPSISPQTATIQSAFANPSTTSSSTSAQIPRLPAPNARFLTCSADAEDLRIGEVRELLSEYRWLVEVIRAAGGFVEDG